MMWVDRAADHPGLAKALVAAGADPSARDAQGMTPVALASKESCAALVQELCVLGASPDTKAGALVGRPATYVMVTHPFS